MAGPFLFDIPDVIPFSLSFLMIYYPELGYGLVSGGILGLGSWIGFGLFILYRVFHLN